MKAFSGSSPVSHPAWLLGALALFFLSACATGRLAEEEEQPSDAETVDVGYGTLDRDQLTGSVSTISGEDAQIGNFMTLAKMLAQVPGVRVFEETGGGITVRIRGNNSFMSGEDPLFVVDGMPFQGDLLGINPTSIATITVLKDAGETAMYGSRGANGVILIRTKR